MSFTLGHALSAPAAPQTPGWSAKSASGGRRRSPRRSRRPGLGAVVRAGSKSLTFLAFARGFLVHRALLAAWRSWSPRPFAWVVASGRSETAGRSASVARGGWCSLCVWCSLPQHGPIRRFIPLEGRYCRETCAGRAIAAACHWRGPGGQRRRWHADGCPNARGPESGCRSNIPAWFRVRIAVHRFFRRVGRFAG